MACFNRQTSRKVSLGTKELDFLTANTELKDREKLSFHFENFIEKHPKGKITKKGFKEMYKELYPNKNCEKIMERMFKMYDKDNDGYIQFRELMMVIYVMSDGSVEDNLRQIFRVFDGNEDGQISLKEMKKFITDIHGLFNPEELESIPEDQLAEKAFKEMDADQDGHITEEEFIQAALKDNKVCKMLALKVVNLISP